MKISKEHFLSLKVILMQNFFKRNYFLDWAQVEGYAELLEELLLAIDRELHRLDNEEDIGLLSPSQQYHMALESIEYDPDNFIHVLNTYEQIHAILEQRIENLDYMIHHFYYHFTRMLLPLRLLLIQCILHDNTFYNQISDLEAFNHIQKLPEELRDYFSRLPILEKTEEIDHLARFIEILRYSAKGNTNDLLDFFSMHPTVTLILIEYIEPLESIYKERFLFLKIILTQALRNESYFFEWSQSSGHYDAIQSVLSPLGEILKDPDTLKEYQTSLDDLEVYPEKFEQFLANHEKIDNILFYNVDFFKKINDEFLDHCIQKLLPLKTMLVQSTIHDSPFGYLMSQSDLLVQIKDFSSKLIEYFLTIEARYQTNEKYKEKISISLTREYTEALHCMQNNPKHLFAFFYKHPTFTIILTNHIKFLTILNQSFLKFLEHDTRHAEDLDPSDLIKELYDFYSEDLQASYKETITTTNINFDPDIRLIKPFYRMTSVSLQESRGNRSIIIQSLENLRSLLTAFFEMKQQLYAQFSWVKEKLPIVDHSEWTEILLDFSREYIESLKKDSFFDIDNVNDPYKNAAIELQRSNGNARIILKTMESLDEILTLKLAYFSCYENRCFLATQREWARSVKKILTPFIKESLDKARKFSIDLKKMKEDDCDRPEWIKDLNDFEKKHTALCDTIKIFIQNFKGEEILQDASLELQRSNGNIDSIIYALECLERKLHARIMCLHPSEIEHYLNAKLSWVNTTLEKLNISPQTKDIKEEEPSFFDATLKHEMSFLPAYETKKLIAANKSNPLIKTENPTEQLCSDFEKATISPSMLSGSSSSSSNLSRNQ